MKTLPGVFKQLQHPPCPPISHLRMNWGENKTMKEILIMLKVKGLEIGYQCNQINLITISEVQNKNLTPNPN